MLQKGGWSDARRLLHDASLRLPGRVAGLLLLLYAQSPVDIAGLTAADIDDGTEMKLTLGAEPIIVRIADAAELAEMLSFLGEWLICDPCLGTLLADYVGHPAYGIQDLRADLDRFIFLLCGDGEHYSPMVTAIRAGPGRDRFTPA